MDCIRYEFLLPWIKGASVPRQPSKNPVKLIVDDVVKVRGEVSLLFRLLMAIALVTTCVII